jgi:hypothetical protein
MMISCHVLSRLISLNCKIQTIMLIMGFAKSVEILRTYISMRQVSRSPLVMLPWHVYLTVATLIWRLRSIAGGSQTSRKMLLLIFFWRWVSSVGLRTIAALESMSISLLMLALDRNFQMRVLARIGLPVLCRGILITSKWWILALLKGCVHRPLTPMQMAAIGISFTTRLPSIKLDLSSVLRSSSVRFFAPKTRNRGPQPVQDRPRYWGDRTGPPRTGLLRSTQPKQTSSDRFFGVIFVVPIEIISISTIITLKIKQVI